MNKSNYFKEISDNYEIYDQQKFLSVVEKINIFICNLSPPLRFLLLVYFFILRFFPSSFNSKKIINYLPKIIGLNLLHQFCVNIFLMYYYDEH